MLQNDAASECFVVGMRRECHQSGVGIKGRSHHAASLVLDGRKQINGLSPYLPGDETPVQACPSAEPIALEAICAQKYPPAEKPRTTLLPSMYRRFSTAFRLYLALTKSSGFPVQSRPAASPRSRQCRIASTFVVVILFRLIDARGSLCESKWPPSPMRFSSENHRLNPAPECTPRGRARSGSAE
jgi:hypothetical protein